MDVVSFRVTPSLDPDPTWLKHILTRSKKEEDLALTGVFFDPGQTDFFDSEEKKIEIQNLSWLTWPVTVQIFLTRTHHY